VNAGGTIFVICRIEDNAKSFEGMRLFFQGKMLIFAVIK
jgi:hypothetical protein